MLEVVALHRRDETPLPQEMALELEHELSYWVSGIPSEGLPLLTSRGRKTSPDVRSCQLTAVMYMVASRELGSDRSFRKTVQEHFKISDSTLQNWKNKFHEEAEAAFKNFRIDLDRRHRVSGIRALFAASARQYRSLIKRQKPRRQPARTHR